MKVLLASLLLFAANKRTGAAARLSRRSFLAELDDFANDAGSRIDDALRVVHHNVSSALGAVIGIRVVQNVREIAIHASSAKSCVKRPERHEALAAATAKLVLVGYGHVGHGNRGAQTRRRALWK